MAKYVYPAQFEPNELNGFCVYFPDMEGASTCGKDLHDSILMAQDALCLMLYWCEQDGTSFAPPSPIYDVVVPEGGLVTLIAADTEDYARFYREHPEKIHPKEPVAV